MKPTLTEKWIVCRVCLKQPNEAMQTIFDKNDEKDLTQMLLECGGVPIKRFDHYPDKICSKCLKYLRVAYKFRITCQRSHKHLSRYIAPVVVEKVEVDNVLPELTLELEEAETVAVKLEPDEVKHEFSDNEDAEVMDIYEPMEDMEDPDFDAEAIEEIQSIIHSGSSMSGEVEYLEIGDELTTSDEEFIPNAKVVKRNARNSVPKQSSKSPSQKPSTSRRGSSAAKKDSPGKRGPKPKKIKKTSFICDICGNMYLSQGRLTEHIKLHKGIKPHVCEICGHAFAQTQQLDRHMNTHTGNRPYKCNYCPAAFADLSTRNKHHRIHTNERPYVCDVCGRAFTYTNTLKFHRMIHTGEKPHVCDICGKGFQQAYKLRNHKLTHEKKGIKLEKIEVDAIANYQEVGVPSQDLEI